MLATELSSQEGAQVFAPADAVGPVELGVRACRGHRLVRAVPQQAFGEFGCRGAIGQRMVNAPHQSRASALEGKQGDAPQRLTAIEVLFEQLCYRIAQPVPIQRGLQRWGGYMVLQIEMGICDPEVPVWPFLQPAGQQRCATDASGQPVEEGFPGQLTFHQDYPAGVTNDGVVFEDKNGDILGRKWLYKWLRITVYSGLDSRFTSCGGHE
jgi:hypothetical protein